MKRHRKQKRPSRARIAGLWGLLILAELTIAAVPAGAVAMLLIPAAYRFRGYPAIGGEWLAIIAIYCGAYALIHRWLCDQIFKEDRGTYEV